MTSGKDVTPKSDIASDDEGIEALERAEAKRATRGTLVDSGLKIGDTLEYANDQSVTAEVISDRKVRLNGKAMTLTAAASELLQKEGYTWKTVPGPRYWLFEGETIAERRKRLSEEMDRKQEEDEWEGH